MAKKRKPLRFPKGHPKAGRFASRAQLARLKTTEKRPPRELIEAIELEHIRRIPWKDYATLERKLRTALLKAGFVLSTQAKMLRKAGHPTGTPIYIHNSPGFSYGSGKTYLPWDVIQIILEPTGIATSPMGDGNEFVGYTARRMWQAFSIVQDHLFLHYPFENDGIMGAYFGEKDFEDWRTGRIYRDQAGWRSLGLMLPWTAAFETVPEALRDAEEEEQMNPYYGVAMFGVFVKIVSKGRS